MKKMKKLSNLETSSFCSEMATIMKAGISTLDGLEILKKDTKDQNGKDLCTYLRDSIINGSSFHDAIVNSHVFPDYVGNMVAIGEASGSLDVVLDSLGIYYKREESIHASVVNAVRYPLIMISMMLLIIIVLLSRVLPIFNRVFEQLGGEITGVAKVFLDLGNSINTYFIVILIIVVVIVLLTLFFRRTTLGKKLSPSVFGWFPPIKRFNEDIAMGRFANGLSLTFSSGLDTFQSLDLVYQLVDNKEIQKKITICKENIRENVPFGESLAQAQLFTHLHARMISVGFKSGTIDEVMDKIATDFEEQTDTKIYNTLSVLEPTLVVVLSSIVGLILLSVILPLMGIMSSIG
jgi:type IV pilus assembly protein PilC